VAAALEAHLATCASCRAEQEALGRLDRVLGAFRDPPVDESRLAALWGRVESQLDAEPASAGMEAPAYLAGSPLVVRRRAAPLPRWLVPVLAVGGVVTLAVVVLSVALVLDRRQPPARETVAQRTGQVKDSPDRDAMGDDAMSDAMSDAMGDGTHQDAMSADPMAGGEAPDAGAAPPDPEDMGTSMGTRRTGSASSGSSGSSGQPRPKTDTMASGTSGTSGTSGSSGMSGSSGSSLSDLLMQSSMSESSSSGSADPSLPEKLSAGDIRSGVNVVMGQARGCYTRYKVAGTCTIRVVVSGSTGRVSGASVTGEFKGTPTGRCVEQAFARASFKRFKSASQSFVFPLIFR
jgi:hypothetical protein